MRRFWAVVFIGLSLSSASLAVAGIAASAPIWIWIVASIAFFACAAILELYPDRQRRKKGRIYTHRPASEIVEAVKDQTSMQAASIVQSYRGKWLKVDGEVRDISELPTLFWWHHIPLVILREESGVTFSMRFKRGRWKAELETLRLGDKLEVEGRITDIGPTTINCHSGSGPNSGGKVRGSGRLSDLHSRAQL